MLDRGVQQTGKSGLQFQTAARPSALLAELSCEVHKHLLHGIGGIGFVAAEPPGGAERPIPVTVVQSVKRPPVAAVHRGDQLCITACFALPVQRSLATKEDP